MMFAGFAIGALTASLTGSQVVLLNKGVICSGTPEEVFADARTKHIFGLLAGETAREAAADIPESGAAETAEPMEGGERG